MTSRAYSAQLVEEIIPYIWDEDRYLGIPDPHTPDSDMPKGGGDPASGNTWVAHLIDVRRAWDRAPLAHSQRQALFAYYRAGMTQREVGLLVHVSQSTVGRLLRQSLMQLADYLNDGE